MPISEIWFKWDLIESLNGVATTENQTKLSQKIKSWFNGQKKGLQINPNWKKNRAYISK